MSEENSDTVTFEDLGLDEYTLKAIEKKGFVTPSPIQVLAIPRLLNGDTNLIARARTGTGKTAAFGLPIIQSIKEKSDCVQALVLEPTRELAMQTCEEMKSFSSDSLPRTTVLYGGASYANQIRDLKKGCEIVVGTPGRIKDHLERKTLDLSKIKYFILDEGDEMLDMGFIDDIREIFEKANQDARILLFSATMPAPILKIAADFMGEYDIIEEEKVIDEALLIDQKYWMVKESEKIEALVRLIDMSPDFYGIVFTMTKMDADNVTRALDMRGYEAAALHGDIMQNQREKVIERFRLKKTRILVATDVAARGIDISGLSHVVNYSLPFDTATYVHRIGRTGRAGTTGIAVTFVRPEEKRKLNYFTKNVNKATKGELKEGKIPSVNEVLTIKESRLVEELRHQLFEEVENTETSESTEIETVESPAENAESTETSNESTESENEKQTTGSTQPPLKNPGKKYSELAAKLCENQNAEEVLAGLLSIMYGEKLSPKHYGKISTKDYGNQGNQTRIFVSLGKKDGYRAKEIADYFSELLHIPGRMVDNIDVAQQFSLVSLPTASAKKAIELSKSNRRLPHMHLDAKEEGRGSRKGGRRSEFDAPFADESPRRGGRDRDRRRSFPEKDFSKKGRRENPKANSPKPNVHAQTQRSSSRKTEGAKAFIKGGKKAERF
ncbi:MAG: DEAD/DEAH box helicase [Treponema sp.]|nr:DEAD/DEAH box helicase [Treponema sp.]